MKVKFYVTEDDGTISREPIDIAPAQAVKQLNLCFKSMEKFRVEIPKDGGKLVDTLKNFAEKHQHTFIVKVQPPASFWKEVGDRTLEGLKIGVKYGAIVGAVGMVLICGLMCPVIWGFAGGALVAFVVAAPCVAKIALVGGAVVGGAIIGTAAGAVAGAYTGYKAHYTIVATPLPGGGVELVGQVETAPRG